MPRPRFPTAYTVLMAVIVVAAAATWLLPAGRYATLRYDDAADRLIVEAADESKSLEPTQATLDSLGVRIALEKFRGGEIRRAVAIPGTYREVEAHRQGIVAVILAPIRGVYEAVDVVVFVLVIGGFIEVFARSGAFDAGVAVLARRLKGREVWLIIVLTSILAVGGTTIGMGEETIAFYPILVPVFLAAGYDLMVPVAVIFGGAGIGFMASTVNPFATIIASDAAGISWTSGLYGRLGMLVLATAIWIAYTIRYANRVRADPAQSIVRPAAESHHVPAAAVEVGSEPPALDAQIKVLLVVFALTFATMIVGVSRLGWWFPEMTGVFLVGAVVLGLIRRTGEKQFTRDFLKGAEGLLGVALIVGIARGVTVILDNGQISGTLLQFSTLAVQDMPRSVFLVTLMFVFAGLTLFISSASGMAVLTMPIMGSLAVAVGVPTEQIVNAYLYGFGMMSLISPSGLILPSLAMVDVSYVAWLRFVLPVLGILSVVSAVFLSLA